VDWTAALTPGAIDVFVKSVRKTVYENGGTSSMYRFLQSIFSSTSRLRPKNTLLSVKKI